MDGRALYELEKFQDSKAALQHAIHENLASVKAWTALGQVEDRLGNAARAEENYRKALDLCGSGSRDCAWPLFELGFLASRRSREKEAERYFRRAIEARTDWAKPHFYLGKTLAGLGQLDSARAELETAASLESDQSQYEYQLAQVYRRIGDHAKSEQHLARYREVKPVCSAAHVEELVAHWISRSSLDLAVPAIDAGTELPVSAGLPRIIGCRERAAAFVRELDATG